MDALPDTDCPHIEYDDGRGYRIRMHEQAIADEIRNAWYEGYTELKTHLAPESERKLKSKGYQILKFRTTPDRSGYTLVVWDDHKYHSSFSTKIS